MNGWAIGGQRMLVLCVIKCQSFLVKGKQVSRQRSLFVILSSQLGNTDLLAWVFMYHEKRVALLLSSVGGDGQFLLQDQDMVTNECKVQGQGPGNSLHPLTLIYFFFFGSYGLLEQVESRQKQTKYLRRDFARVRIATIESEINHDYLPF